MNDRTILDAERKADDFDASIRPERLADFTGQEQARANLSVFIEAARQRGEALDHVLFVGPPGLGKTTLAQIMAKELGVNFRSTSGPVIAKAGDLAALLTNLGYSSQQASAAVSAVLAQAGEDADSGTLIRLGLKELSS